MPFDTTTTTLLHHNTEAAPDLSTPSIEALAWMLRRRELWPTAFKKREWDFTHRCTCAVGLADCLWGVDRVNRALFFGPLFPAIQNNVFAADSDLYPVAGLATPEDVADQLDKLSLVSPPTT